MQTSKFEVQHNTDLHLILKATRTLKSNLVLNIKEETKVLQFFDFSLKGEFIYMQKHGLVISLFKRCLNLSTVGAM